ncbi:hypothetical protein VQ7734_04784 [Vibrio quintilis]|uniref:Uncharacterized protein n=1 Tax=Vibrio quintilis TaxID=1117707 RepID=A0A1M7Z224_9VIBR|nr:hypothetical protein VQ7734_04784 [Vibrio quintilis]
MCTNGAGTESAENENGYPDDLTGHLDRFIMSIVQHY